jgi:carboxyl-terminal processing protease
MGRTMAQWLKKYWIGVVILATTGVYVPLAGRTGEDRATQKSLDTLTEIMGLVEKQAVDPPSPRAIAHASISGMLHTLDPHSYYMDESEFRAMRDEQRGSFFGIGSIIVQQPDGIVIVSTVRGGPSEKVGLRAGDIIREIDGKSTENWTSSAAVQKLRGEKGTVVEVAVQRMGFPGLVRFSITRSEIPSNSVYYCFMLNGTTGFITIKDFGETTSEEFERAVRTLKGQGMKSLILDLRFNGGGMLDAALGICRQLLGPNELIVTQRGRDGKDVVETRTPKGSSIDPFPMVVLINRGSASASEIVTGAVQDHDRGLVVGQTSWGKGLVQAVMAINRTRGLALTTARYYTPSGRCIQRDYMHGLDDYLLPDENGKEPAQPQGPKCTAAAASPRTTWRTAASSPPSSATCASGTARSSSSPCWRRRSSASSRSRTPATPPWRASRPGWPSRRSNAPRPTGRTPRTRATCATSWGSRCRTSPTAWRRASATPAGTTPRCARPWRSCPRPRPC